MNHVTRTCVAVVLAGCGSEDRLHHELRAPGEPVENDEVTDILVQAFTPVVDVLFMVDNSCSMGSEQEHLAANIQTFMHWFVDTGLDYHIGVVSSDMVDPTHMGRLRMRFGKKWISTDDDNQIAWFQAMVDTGGHAPERGTGSIFSSQAREPARTYNDGFFRASSAMHTICVSDEMDYSQREGDIALSDFIDWYGGLRRNADALTFSAIVDPSAVSYIPGGNEYAEVTGAVGGVVWNLRDDDWSGALDALGLRTSGRTDEVFLSRDPIDETIRVTVRTPAGGEGYHEATYRRAYRRGDGFVDAEGEPAFGEVWSYNDISNSITFVDVVPEPLAQVVVEYQAAPIGLEEIGA